MLQRLRKAALVAVPTCWLWLYEPHSMTYRFWRTNFRVPEQAIVEASRCGRS